MTRVSFVARQKYANIPVSPMPLASFRVALLLSLGLLSAAAAPRALGQQVEDSIYGPLPVFEFHSGFWVNLHHFLYHEARAREAVKDSRVAATRPAGPVLKQSPASQPTLTPAEQRIWDQAVAYYVSSYAGKDLLVNIDLILLKNQLGDFEDCNELTGRKKPACDAGLPGNVGIILEAAAPIYRAHWWADHDRANRRWVVRVAPLVREQGVGLSQRLADIYQSKWPKEKIRVEVCAFANSAGAYTTLDPLRVTIASTDPRNQGPEALEVLFHEASHDIARPVEAAITRECRQRDKPIPRDLWHALIFFTTGEVLRPIMQEAEQQNAPDDDVSPQRNTTTTVPPGLREKLSQRGWEEYSRLLAIYWQPYLDGKVTFEDAIARLVSAV
ncbi:MAG: hypothetical protein ABSG77_03045 [Candidatus Acidiferrum sp.]